MDQLEPWGEDRDDYRFATLSAILVNALGLRRPDNQPWMAHHFILDYRTAWKSLPADPVVESIPETPSGNKVVIPKKRQQTVEEMQQWIELWVRGSNLALKERRTSRR